MKSIGQVLLTAMLCVSNAYAADIAEAVRKGASGPDISDGGYFELGAGLRTWYDDGNEHKGVGFVILASGAYRYRRFFFESSHSTQQ